MTYIFWTKIHPRKILFVLDVFIQVFYFSLKFKVQRAGIYNNALGRSFGPSLKTCPKCTPVLLHCTPMRCMP